MTRLIDADALIEKYTVVIRKTADEKLKTEIAVLLKDIEELPTIDTEELPSHSSLIGWVCPFCGRGLSPYTSVCPCQNQKGWEITCG